MVNVYNVLLSKEDRIPCLVKEAGYKKSSKRNSPKEIVTLLNDVFSMEDLAEEKSVLVCLRSDGSVSGLFEVSHGTANASFMNSREILLRALLCGATGIVLAHNHPSGDPTPSKTDIDTTKQIKDACVLGGINLLDHVIVGENGNYHSFKEKGLL